jgi:transposase-like protein
MDRAMLTMAMAMAAMADPTAVATDVARRLGITTTTLYTYYINGDGSPKAAGRLLLPTTAEVRGR